MRLRAIAFMAVLLCAGCAAVDEQPENPLAQADAKLIAEDYAGAISSYAEFAAAQPGHAHAQRARATQKALERVVAAEAAMNRAQQGSVASRRELTERQAETDRLKGEIAKLRADLERLRNIDLQLQQKK